MSGAADGQGGGRGVDVGEHGSGRMLGRVFPILWQRVHAGLNRCAQLN